MAKIIEDTRQKIHDGDKHAAKHSWWAAHGVEVERRKLDFGDYMAEGSNRSVDTKRDLYEIMGNLGSGYRRLDHECAAAREAGCRLVFLVEAGERYAEPEELAKVRSRYCVKCPFGKKSGGAAQCDPTDPHSGCAKRGNGRKPFQGYQMASRMKRLHDKYGAEFMFCSPFDSAKIICELLGVDVDD